MELIIHSPSEEGFIQEITFNHEEIKKELTTRLEKYKGLVYSEEEIKLAKTDRATLNKFKEAIESKRKEIKALCLKPYDEFEIKIKEIVNLVNEPVKDIDNQVKAFEEKQKQDKKKVIEGMYSDMIGDLIEILPLKTLWNEKWLNATYKLATISDELRKEIERVSSDLKHIESIKSKFETEMKNTYLNTLLLSEALAIKTRLEDQEIKLEEFKAKQEAEKKPEPPPEFPATPAPTFSQAMEMEQVIEPELEVIEFRLWVTPEQKAFLRNYIFENNIKFGKVR